MSRGRRYEEPKLNMKKVFAVIIAIIVIIMFIFIIKGILDKDEEQGMITSETYFVSYKDNKWGVINQEGEIITKPIYELDWYYPTFIGKYYRLNIWTSESQYSDEIE